MSGQETVENHLHGWKAIARHLDRSVRTVQRWEAEDGLPVRRLQHTGSVLAYRSEIEVWRNSVRGRAAMTASPGPDGPSHAERGHPEPPDVPQIRARPHVAGDDRGPTPTSRDRHHRPPWRLAGGVLAATALSAAFGWHRSGQSTVTLVCPGDCTVQQGHTVVLRADGASPESAFLRWIQSESGAIESFRPELKPDAGGTVTWGFSTDCRSTPGVHIVRLVDVATEDTTNAVSIRIISNASCLLPVPDLLAETVSVVALGDGMRTVRCRFTLRNQGDAPAPPSVARLRLGTSPDRTAVTDTMLADVSAPGLPVGSSVVLEAEFHVPDKLPTQAAYYVWVVADNGSAMVERVSSNNFARSPALVLSPEVRR